jgi:hypothetical protein
MSVGQSVHVSAQSLRIEPRVSENDLATRFVQRFSQFERNHRAANFRTRRRHFYQTLLRIDLRIKLRGFGRRFLYGHPSRRAF